MSDERFIVKLRRHTESLISTVDGRETSMGYLQKFRGDIYITPRKTSPTNPRQAKYDVWFRTDRIIEL